MSAPAVIVEIDEASLSRYGQWPWPRTLLARLVARIAEGGPAAVGLDMVMPEPDRLSPARLPEMFPFLDEDLVARLRRIESNDARLGALLATVPAVVGVAGLDGPGRTLARSTPVRQVGPDPRPFLRQFKGALATVDEIDRAAAGRGLLNIDPDDRVVRRVPLVAAVGPVLVPGLAVEMLRVAAGLPTFSVYGGTHGMEAVGIGDLRIPTQPDGTAWLHFTGHDPGRFVSASAVLSGNVDARTFSRRLVLVGVTALGLADQTVTPVAGRMLGVEIQAQALEDLFDGDLLHRPRWGRWAEAAALGIVGVVLVLLVPALPLSRALLVAVPVLVAVPAAGFGLYRGTGLLLDGASPAIGLAAVLTVMLAAGLAEVDSQRRALRRQLVREREATARIEGELQAARRIQMGILPDPRQVLAGEKRVSVAALLEPAREVGGDLYDVFRLDEDRLFFLIGDVSGKGLPGALFMAVAKALGKSAALRSGGDPAAVLGAAGTELGRENPEALFVTVFAGVLDARTGELTYSNAGHENPQVAAPETGAVVQLVEGGGPPLCVVDDFPYRAASRRMRPGETLCLVTDGVVEAMNAAGECYGRARLGALLQRTAPLSTVEELGQAIVADVRRFAAGAEPSDDLALLILRWTPE